MTKPPAELGATVLADGQQIFDSGVVTTSTPTVRANSDVSGAQIRELNAGDDITYGNAGIVAPQLTYAA